MKWLQAGQRSGWLLLLAVAGIIELAQADIASAPEPNDGALEEVIVTARKVRENVQDIPLSVQVLTGKRLDEIDLSVLFDLQHEVPGLVVNSLGLNGAGFALRGVADQGGTSASVATHLNEVYLGASNLALARLFDLERVEVLKGPQGTLYGRNSTGGTLNFVTRAPEDKFGGALEGAYGSFDTVRLQGHLNAPLGDSAAVRVAFIGSEGDGFIRNSVDDRRFAEQDYWGLRGALRFDPGERWRIDFVAQRSYDDGASAELWLPNPEFLPDPDDIHLTTVNLANPFLKIESDNVNLTVEYDFGHTQLRTLTGFAKSELNNLDDCAGRPMLKSCVRGADPSRDEQWSQEVQLSSAGERLDWLAGAYFFSGKADRHFFQLLPLLNPRPLNDQFSTSDDTVWALFSQSTLHFGDGWGVTGGLRYSDEVSEISNIGTGVRDNQELVVLEDHQDHLSWRLDLEYRVHEGLLLYSGVSTGFKSGGVTAVLLPEGDYNRFDPENLLAFETGLKGQWPGWGLVLDVAAFHYDFDDLQVTSVYVFNEERVIPEIENASGAQVYGLDLSASAQLSERLDLSGGLVWLPKREFVDYTSPRTGQDLSGNELSRAPEWSAIASLGYHRAVGGRGEFSARLEYYYRSTFYYTKENLESESQGAHGLLNLLLRFEAARGNWYAFASGRNLTDEDYFHQVFLQSTPGYPDTYEVGLGFRF